MPGPTPPSKSYSIQIIDSSDDEDSDDDGGEADYYANAGRRTSNEVANEKVASATRSREESVQYEERRLKVAEQVRKAQEEAANNVSQENGAAERGENASPKKKKKKKNKKKKKKKRSASDTVTDDDDGDDDDDDDDDELITENEADKSAASVDNSNGSKTKTNGHKKKVRFDSVLIYSFERCLGLGVVPYDGGWPLGLGETIVYNDEKVEAEEPQVVVTLDVYETSKQEKLRIRSKERIGEIATIAENDESRNNLPNYDDEDTILETRQWDYKQGIKNPLFYLLLEDQRMALLLEASTPTKDDTDNNNNDYAGGGSSSPNGKSFSKRNSKGRERSNSIVEQFNDTYTQLVVHHVRNELEELRFSRSGEGHVGCNCRKTVVYLLPPGGGGKKAHHRRMKVLRVTEELTKRHMLPTETKTREELELLLHDAIEREACCISADCPCVRNGIECQADTCDCWHDSHQTKEQKQNDVAETVEDIEARCGNPNGMYAVDLDQISKVRLQKLEAYT